MKLEKNCTVLHVRKYITLGSKFKTLQANRAHNYKQFPKRVSPYTVISYWFMSVNEKKEGRHKEKDHFDPVFEFGGLYIHNET